MLELHVWGPGFGLPSIDPLCLAAIAYLNLVLPREEWKVVPSSNPLLSPNSAFLSPEKEFLLADFDQSTCPHFSSPRASRKTAGSPASHK
jgi:hypothetical protein